MWDPSSEEGSGERKGNRQASSGPPHVGGNVARHALAHKLVYCHEALYLREKLQKATFKQKIEKWVDDSDSDSDESDEWCRGAELRVKQVSSM